MLYALDALLPTNENQKKSELLNALDSHVIDEAKLIGKYEKF